MSMSWKSCQLIKLRPRKDEMNGCEGEDALGDGAGLVPEMQGTVLEETDER